MDSDRSNARGRRHVAYLGRGGVILLLCCMAVVALWHGSGAISSTVAAAPHHALHISSDVTGDAASMRVVHAAERSASASSLRTTSPASTQTPVTSSPASTPPSTPLATPAATASTTAAASGTATPAATATTTAAATMASAPAVVVAVQGAPGTSAAPLNAILAAAPGLPFQTELLRTLVSLSLNVPNAVVCLLLKPAEAEELKRVVVAPGSPAAPGALPMWVRVYSFDVLDARAPSSVRERFPSIRRYSYYDAVLDDLADGGAANAGANPPLVLFSTLDAAHHRTPDAVMLSDARDVVFQRDPFPVMWSRYFNVGDAQGRGWTAAAAARLPPSLVAAQEARTMTLEQEDWNRSWVHYCYYYLGEAMVGKQWILCSGTTMGNEKGIRAYLAAMQDGATRCMDIGWEKGMDQGIHNVLLRGHTPSEWATLRKRIPEPRLNASGALLDAVAELQSRLNVHIAEAEGDLLCTMALMSSPVTYLRDIDGYVVARPDKSLPHGDTSPRCAVVHQFDRSQELAAFYSNTYQLSSLVPQSSPPAPEGTRIYP